MMPTETPLADGQLILQLRRELESAAAVTGNMMWEYADMRDKLAAAESARRDAKFQAQRWHILFDAAVLRLSHIHGLLFPEDVEHAGKRFEFNPPDELMREVWKGLSQAIRDIQKDNEEAIRATFPDDFKEQP